MPLKLICSAMETWVVLLLAVFASIELFLVRHQVCFRKWQCEEGFMSSLPRRNSFRQTSVPSEDIHKTQCANWNRILIAILRRKDFFRSSVRQLSISTVIMKLLPQLWTLFLRRVLLSTCRLTKAVRMCL